MENANVSLPKKNVEQFCLKYNIRKLSLFGSILREDFKPESDVDVLIEFEEGHTPGFIRLAGIELELSRILGRKADLRTPQELSRYFRDDVMKSAKVQYARR